MNDKIKKKLKVSANVRNTLKIMSGTAVSQGISFVTLPIITRIYGAKIMGVMAIVTAIAAVINAFSDLGISKSIMMDDDDKLLDTYTVVSTLSFLICLVIGIGFFVYYKVSPSKDAIPAFIMALLIGIYSWLAKQVQICYTWLNRQKKYNILMRNPMLNQVAIAVVSIVLGLIGFKRYGYYIGFISGTFITLINMKSNLPLKIFTLNISKYIRVIKENKRYIIYQTPADIFGQIKNTLPTMLIKKIFGTEMVGYFSISIRLINIPINLLGMSAGRVFFSELGQMKREGKEIKYFIEKNVEKAFRIAMVLFLVVFAFGDVLATIFLGKEWYTAGQMLRIVSFMGLFEFISLSTQGICIVISKQNYTVAYSVCQIITGLLSYLAIGMMFHNVLLSLMAYTISVVIIQVVYFCFIYRAVELSVIKYLKNVVLDISFIILGTVILRFIAMQFSIVSSIFI